MSDEVILVATLAASALTAIVVVLCLARWRPGWSRRRTAVLAALPVPMAIWLLCGWVIVSVMTTPREKCGVDACGIAFGFSVIAAATAVLIFLGALGLAAAIDAMVRRQ